MQRGSRSTQQEREFGLVVGAVFALLGSWWIYRAKLGPVGPASLGLGAVLILLGLLAPALLARPRHLWMRLAEGMAFVMTRVILFLVFFLVVTPIGWLRRASGSDPLRRRTRTEGSFWVEYPVRQHDPRHFEKMF